MSLNPVYLELFAALDAAAVEYLVVGGYAFTFHAEPRYTKDLDVWIRPSEENAKRVGDALAAFGVPPKQYHDRQFTQPDTVFFIGEVPGRIDLLTGMPELSFEDAWRERVVGTFGDRRVPFISRRHLIAVKRISGRTRDLADIERLELQAEVERRLREEVEAREAAGGDAPPPGDGG